MNRHLFISLIALFVITFGMTGCASLNPEIFQSQKKIDKPLLPLEIHIFDEVTSSTNAGRMYGTDLPPKEGWYITHREFFRNVFNDDSRKYGYGLVQVKRTEFFNILYAIISGCSLLSINLVGFPVGSFTVYVDLDFSIMDAQRNVIAKYSVEGTGSAYEAMYWGYGRTELMQVSHTKALINALDELKDQVAKDSARINEQLTAAGPIKSWEPAALTRK